MCKHALPLVVGCLVVACQNDTRKTTSASASTTASASAPLAEPIRPQVPDGRDVAILAGGCYWGMEEILRSVDGVVDTDVGFAGGTQSAPSYSDVKKGTTGHAESVKIVFDPSRISYAELLEKWFFRMHDPTTPNRQGNDVGTQYRSAIFYTSAEQRRIAIEVRKKVDEAGQWKKPIVTEIVPATVFTAAHEAHQDYLQKNPRGYTCHYMRDFGG